MQKLNLNKRMGRRGLLFSTAIALGFSLGALLENPAQAELSPELQNQVNQILAAGGSDVLEKLTELSEANPGAAADILLAGISGGVECQGLSTSISQYTDDETDDELQDIVDDVCDDDEEGDDELSTHVGDTSENPNQTSGSETDSQ